MFYYVIILFALLIAVLLLVDFMMKRALTEGKSEESEGEKPSRVAKFMKGVDFFLALPLATIAVNHFQVSVYTRPAFYTGLSVLPDRPFLFISICPQLSPSAHHDR